MKGSFHDRPCVAHKDWSEYSLEEKVELLADWAEEVTKFLESVYQFKCVTKKAAIEMEAVLSGIGGKMNGGGPPVKHPKDPGC